MNLQAIITNIDNKQQLVNRYTEQLVDFTGSSEDLINLSDLITDSANDLAIATNVLIKFSL
tara:strand:+ start:319 stop:501 length:183 start_codon:yes stop_codon:yes gene_type:complete